MDSSVNSKWTIGVLFLSLNPMCRDYLPSRYFCYWYVHALYWFAVISCPYRMIFWPADMYGLMMCSPCCRIDNNIFSLSSLMVNYEFRDMCVLFL
jgi:hypothetical protein